MAEPPGRAGRTPDVVLSRAHISGYGRGLRPGLASTHHTLATSHILKRTPSEDLGAPRVAVGAEEPVCAIERALRKLLDPAGAGKLAEAEAAEIGGSE